MHAKYIDYQSNSTEKRIYLFFTHTAYRIPPIGGPTANPNPPATSISPWESKKWRVKSGYFVVTMSYIMAYENRDVVP